MPKPLALPSETFPCRDTRTVSQSPYRILKQLCRMEGFNHNLEKSILSHGIVVGSGQRSGLQSGFPYRDASRTERDVVKDVISS
jgi:hypothetical protein